MDYGIKLMKKMNNKYRNNNNQIYSLNYKFDSTSIAGKISGTALDLIKKYNELAKEAHGNGNYVEMEVFRQYAEHYRKIVTEINEKKNQNQNRPQEKRFENQEEAGAPVCNDNAETGENAGNVVEMPVAETVVQSPRREFKVIEISAAEANAAVAAQGETVPAGAEQPKAKRTYRKKAAAAAAAANKNNSYSGGSSSGGGSYAPGTPQQNAGSGKQQAVVNACYSTPSPGLNWCAAWVTNVFRNAGVGYFGGNACDMFNAWCYSSDRSALQVGMIVADSSHSGTGTPGLLYGHVGIYVGGGIVMSNEGAITSKSLDSFISFYGTGSGVRWGWLGGVALS